jgi:hypothetical protein
MSEQTREPQTQQSRTTTIQPAPGTTDRRGDTTVPVDGMSPVIELEINPGPPRPHIPPEKEGVQKTS